MGDDQKPIDLARAPDFVVGDVSVRPSLRQVIEADGHETMLEPRVMQVLVALADAKGAIVSRDDLTVRCWSGRIVGEDAINRVISRLRRLADETGAFRIETITKVGYRLLVEGQAETAAKARARPDRRLLLAGGAASVVAIGAGALLGRRWLKPAKPDVMPLIVQATTALEQGTAESNDQAIGLLKRAVELSPEDEIAWGVLAFVYAAAVQRRSPQMQADLTARAREAARRAEALHPGDPNARAALILLEPGLRRWAWAEQSLRDLIKDHPENLPARMMLAEVLGAVGRWRESAAIHDKVDNANNPTPGRVQRQVQALWSAGRLQEADRAIERAVSMYPTHFAVWFTHFHLLLYTGRAREALAKVDNLEGRPETVEESNFQLIRQVAKGMVSGAPADIDEAVERIRASARAGAGHAENAVQFASALGRTETAFEIAQAYFFGQGFVVPDIRFEMRQKTFTPLADRRTNFLFFPSTAGMRDDARFAQLTEALGLAAYWRETRTRPDYQVA
ncbi:winged helix-turn-helix domain-containing protein [Caulobacter sp.]|uniref:winged helix-turn-helix domain-containing protein n=1 Tax=Caulobacter sp. TaxID=78 RepID=UPI001B0EBA2F|nr:winged helix-turn-helix domain-containing protein [Caulobacter sp.]MBO9546448.1 winged helix-turn-helix domain-containing protein [Caulobacter sp.]